MNTQLLNRQYGALNETSFQQEYTTKLLNALQPADVRFEGNAVGVGGLPDNEDGDDEDEDSTPTAVAHSGGVTSITIDRFEGRYLLSGGADSTVSIWDLESAALPSPDGSITLEPLTASGRTKGHKFGITAVQFYPFDSLAFTSSSYDHTLKLSSSETLQVSASFNLESVVYDHASSPIAQHLLVACATQHPNVRLVDLRSGSAAQALPGHHGAIMSVVWSPKDEFILASGGLDGTVRFWDVRRSAAQLGCLDMEDSIGIMGYDGLGRGARPRDRGRAHMGPVNGLTWTDDGKHLVSASHDEKIRIWNVIKGANTLANFGPLIRNRDLRRNVPCLVPTDLTAHGSEALAIANEREIMMFEMFEGKLMKRMRAPGVAYTGHSSTSATQKTKVLDLAWRTHAVELYSAHGDGSIRAWKPRTAEDVQADEEEREIERLEHEQRQKKRKVFEDMYSDLASKRFAIR